MPPNPLLERFAPLLQDENIEGPILDLACGKGQNGLYLARLGFSVILADRDTAPLRPVLSVAQARGESLSLWTVDLEKGGNPLEENYYRAILVFRYLHRPLIPCLRKGVRKGGVLIYETFTKDQPQYGHPYNPSFLLNPGELRGWFQDWQLIYYFEGLLENPTRAMAQIVCRKP
jgi:tellurite methyltransferase